jgi:ribonuclease I
MSTYWLPNRGSAEVFWQHEWNKHGTCVNTLARSCYGDGYQAGDEVVDFMSRAVEVFKVFRSPFAQTLKAEPNERLGSGHLPSSRGSQYLPFQTTNLYL